MQMKELCGILSTKAVFLRGKMDRNCSTIFWRRIMRAIYKMDRTVDF